MLNVDCLLSRLRSQPCEFCPGRVVSSPGDGDGWCQNSIAPLLLITGAAAHQLSGPPAETQLMNCSPLNCAE